MLNSQLYALTSAGTADGKAIHFYDPKLSESMNAPTNLAHATAHELCQGGHRRCCGSCAHARELSHVTV